MLIGQVCHMIGIIDGETIDYYSSVQNGECVIPYAMLERINYEDIDIELYETEVCQIIIPEEYR